MISCYQIEEVLGRGGFAVTYLAIDLNLDVHVAIKEYLPREIIQRDDQLNVSARRPEFVEDYNIGLSNFAREAKTLARFKHLNIVRVHQVIHKYSTAYMVMDYEHGQEFADVLADEKTIPEDALREILFPIFDGVEEIHRAGLAHRDIKPSNIYLRENGSPVLLDFGAARYTMSETTQQLTAVVTVGYTPIEQYNVSDNDQGPWSDIYALAAVLYEAVTGEMPVDSVTRASCTLTKSEDPLGSVSNKAQKHYSDNFLKAIDWGLRMEAEDRPQSIAQWRAAFNGDYRPASAFVQKKPSGPPARPSKLKTRDKHPPPVDHEPQQAPQYQSDPRLTEENPDPRLSVDVRATRFDPRFDEDIHDVEIIPLNGSETISQEEGSRVFDDRRDSYYPQDDATHDALADQDDNSTTRIQPSSHQARAEQPGKEDRGHVSPPASPFASNPAIASQRPRQAANRNTIEPTPLNAPVAENQTLNDTLNNIANNPGQTTHTQELRNVLRRDIVKRPPATPPAAPTETPADRDMYPPPYRSARAENPVKGEFDNRRAPVAEAPLQQNIDRSPPRMEREPIRQAPIRNEIEFDETDWDYEPPTPPSKWRWLLPATGLIAVVGGSLLFVNKPELFKIPGAGAPEMTVAAALDKAQQQMADDALMYPAGQSALDYYQLILSSEPDNQQALDGIANIQSEVKRQIIESIDANDLNEANRLLSRANDSGLQIDGLPGSAKQNQSSQSGAIAIDTSMSPRITGKIADIQQLISEGRYLEAEELFEDTDKYLADADLSSSLRTQIQNGKNGTDSLTENTTSVEDQTSQFQELLAPITNNQATLSPEQNNGESVFSNGSTTSDTTQIDLLTANSNSENSGIIPDATALPIDSPILPEPEQEDIFRTETTQNIDTGSVTLVESRPATDNDQQVALVSEPETLPSAPRRSFIEGNDATAQHLNQLRLAIEAKNLRGVLDISDSLPAERTEFLRKMFQRYDRLDVTIDDINTASTAATARLSVSMFNQRGDGSYYSAGKWNGVTLATNRQNGIWQKIKW